MKYSLRKNYRFGLAKLPSKCLCKDYSRQKFSNILPDKETVVILKRTKRKRTLKSTRLVIIDSEQFGTSKGFRVAQPPKIEKHVKEIYRLTNCMFRRHLYFFVPFVFAHTSRIDLREFEKRSQLLCPQTKIAHCMPKKLIQQIFFGRFFY